MTFSVQFFVSFVKFLVSFVVKKNGGFLCTQMTQIAQIYTDFFLSYLCKSVKSVSSVC